jgi:hypothetical protein
MKSLVKKVVRVLFAVAASVGAIAFPALSFSADVRGVAKDAVTQRPVAGARIRLVIAGYSPIPTIASAITQSDGSYSMNFPADSGGNTFFTSAVGYAPGYFRFDPANGVQNFVFTPVAAIVGTLYDPSSNPIDGSSVFLVDPQTKSYLTGSPTYGGGKFAFNNIPPGTYWVCQSNPYDEFRDGCYDHSSVGPDGILRGQPVTVAERQLVENIDVHLEAGAAVSGSITDRISHAPTQIITLDIVLYTPQGAIASEISSNTDERGGYRIAGLSPGDYYLTLGAQFSSNEGYYPQIYGGPDCDSNTLVPPSYLADCPFIGVAPLTVPAGGLSAIDFDLSSGGIVSGRVVDAQSGLGIPGVTVDACTPPSYYPTAMATTDDTGRYVMTHLLRHFTVNTRAPGYMDQMWPHTLFDDSEQCGSTDPQSNLSLPTPAATLSGIDFSLSKGSHVSGIVTDTRGRSAHVAVFHGGYPPALVEDITTDSNGAFVISDLIQSPYYSYYTAVAYLDDGVTCVIYGDIPCGAAWRVTDPSSADVSDGRIFEAGLGTVILNLDFHFITDPIFHDGFDIPITVE